MDVLDKKIYRYCCRWQHGGTDTCAMFFIIHHMTMARNLEQAIDTQYFYRLV